MRDFDLIIEDIIETYKIGNKNERRQNALKNILESLNAIADTLIEIDEAVSPDNYAIYPKDIQRKLKTCSEQILAICIALTEV